MKGLFQIIFVFSAVLATVSGLKCYECAGTDKTCSKDELKKDSSKESTCESGLDRCMRVWAKKGDTTAVVNSCSNELLCKTAKDTKCDVDKCAVDCCDSDLCNAGHSLVSGLKCYECIGTDKTCSKDELKKDSSKESTCASGMDRCMRVWAKKGDTKAVVNSCSNESLCKAAEDAKCDVDKCAVGCCDTDLCNAGSPVSFSVFLMTVCCTVGLALLK